MMTRPVSALAVVLLSFSAAALAVGTGACGGSPNLPGASEDEVVPASDDDDDTRASDGIDGGGGPAVETCAGGAERACSMAGDGVMDGVQICVASGELATSWGMCAPVADGGASDASADAAAGCVYEIAVDQYGDELKGIRVTGELPACARCCETTCHQTCSGACGGSGAAEERGDCYKDTFLGGGSGTSAFVDATCKVLSVGAAPAGARLCGKANILLK